MRTVRWLHISDLHIQEAENAQRQAVLSEMLDEISRRSKTGVRMDFVVATGDLAFSGKCSEYELVAGFLSNLVDSVGIFSDKVFCIPGNHDVQRDRSKMCFLGTRSEIKNEGDELPGCVRGLGAIVRLTGPPEPSGAGPRVPAGGR